MTRKRAPKSLLAYLKKYVNISYQTHAARDQGRNSSQFEAFIVIRKQSQHEPRRQGNMALGRLVTCRKKYVTISDQAHATRGQGRHSSHFESIYEPKCIIHAGLYKNVVNGFLSTMFAIVYNKIRINPR